MTRINQLLPSFQFEFFKTSSPLQNSGAVGEDNRSSSTLAKTMVISAMLFGSFMAGTQFHRLNSEYSEASCVLNGNGRCYTDGVLETGFFINGSLANGIRKTLDNCNHELIKIERGSFDANGRLNGSDCYYELSSTNFYLVGIQEGTFNNGKFEKGIEKTINKMGEYVRHVNDGKYVTS